MIEKLKYVLKEIFKNDDKAEIVELIDNSDFLFEDHWNQQSFSNAYNILIRCSPNVYTKHYRLINSMEKLIKATINNCSELLIDKLAIKPDYDKLTLLNSEVTAIVTPWDEINKSQEKLISDMKRSDQSIDFQNIGNASRTIMDKLARLVFDKNIHGTEGIDTGNGKFKNQFHSYISHELSGRQSKELRQFAISAIDFTENAIDLMNQTTHKLDVQKHFAEVCVISTINIISLIRAINENKNTQS